MRRTTIWLTGARGRLGSGLKPLLHADRSLKVVETDLELDVSSEPDVLAFADMIQPDIIINCASLSDREYCQNHKAEAFKVNTLGARNLAAAARKHNAAILQLSSDEVFNGSEKDSCHEFDQPVPTNIYGQSKLAAETLVRELNPKHTIVRSSWIYGSGKNDFYQEILEHAGKNEPFPVSSTRISSPTSTDALAGFVHTLIHHPIYGTFHASDTGKVSRSGFARKVLELNGYSPDLVEEISDENNQTCLENLMMEMTDLYTMPDWQADLQRYVEKKK